MNLFGLNELFSAIVCNIFYFFPKNLASLFLGFQYFSTISTNQFFQSFTTHYERVYYKIIIKKYHLLTIALC